MKLDLSPKSLNLGFFLLLVIFCCAPVWTVEYFINQDGSAHLHSAYLMGELLAGSPSRGEIFALNSLSTPNSSGHWLMIVLLYLFSPFVITKIMVTLTFAGFVAAVGWLRVRTNGLNGVKTSCLIGAAIAFNWLWLCGFYNFLIGASCFVFTVGLFYGWREKMNPARAAMLSLLFLLAYLSHIISFAILAGSVFLLIFSTEKQFIKRNLLYYSGALLPVLPLIVIYKTISASGGGFYPVWRSLEEPFSMLGWMRQLRTADPFIIISRKTLPFLPVNSGFLSIFTPVLWILGGLFALAAATVKRHRLNFFSSRTNSVFFVLLILSVGAALFAPDDFGLSNGSILRERLLICGLVFFVPLFCAENSPRLKRIAQFCLILIVLFQTLALWDYAGSASTQAREFLAAQNAVPSGVRLASVIVSESPRFNSNAPSMLCNYLGMESDRLVWDNYEIGHYLFPAVARRATDKQFVFELTSSNNFVPSADTQQFKAKLSRLEALLAANNQRIDYLIVWDKNERIDEVLSRWFEIAPVFEQGRVRVFRHKL